MGTRRRRVGLEDSDRRAACLRGVVSLWLRWMSMLSTCCSTFDLFAVVEIFEELSCMCWRLVRLEDTTVEGTHAL
jgi:hypothetical protein